MNNRAIATQVSLTLFLILGGALTIIALVIALGSVAERVGFEPTVPLPARRISSAVLSTSQPPLRMSKMTPGRLSAGKVGGGL